MTNSEIAKDIIVALIGSQHTSYFCDADTAQQVAESYEIIYNKLEELRNK